MDPSAATVVRAAGSGIYVVIQQVENNYLVPRIIGGAFGCIPWWSW